jgi:hypothetical protein
MKFVNRHDGRVTELTKSSSRKGTECGVGRTAKSAGIYVISTQL